MICVQLPRSGIGLEGSHEEGVTDLTNVNVVVIVSHGRQGLASKLVHLLEGEEVMLCRAYWHLDWRFAQFSNGSSPDSTAVDKVITLYVSHIGVHAGHMTVVKTFWSRKPYGCPLGVGGNPEQFTVADIPGPTLVS